MPTTEYGPKFFDEFGDMQRRLALLERSERVGLNRIEFAQQTNTFTFSVFDAWRRTEAGVTLPSISNVQVGTKVVVTCGGTLNNFGADASLKCKAGELGFGINGLDPDNGTYLAGVIAKRLFNLDATGFFQFPFSFSVIVTNLVPGLYSFEQWGRAVLFNGAHTVFPSFDDTTMQVTPIDLG